MVWQVMQNLNVPVAGISKSQRPNLPVGTLVCMAKGIPFLALRRLAGAGLT
jgi:hypothetical protein